MVLYLWYEEVNMLMMSDSLRPLVVYGVDQMLRVNRLSTGEVSVVSLLVWSDRNNGR